MSPTADSTESARDAGTFEATEGRTLPAGTETTTIDGVTFGVPGYSILAVVEGDFDADSDRDALVAVRNETETALAQARREREGYSRTLLSRSPFPEGCTVEGANVRVHSPQIAVVTSRLRCAEGPRVAFEVVTIGGTSRAAFSVDVTPPSADDPYLASLTVTPRVADANSDGVNDVVFDVETQDRFGGARRKESFAITQGITGFTTNLSTVVTRARAIARSADRDLRRQAARAARDAAHGLAFVRALCPEAGDARVRLRSAAAGCGQEGERARFTGTLAVALAKTARLDDLLRLVDAIAATGDRLPDTAYPTIAEALRASRGRVALSYQLLPLPPGVTAGATFGFGTTGEVVTTGEVAGSFAATAPFAFTPDETVALAPPLAVRRFGSQYVITRGGRARVVGPPELDATVVRDCVFDPPARRILCTTDAGPMVAAIGGTP